MKIKIVSVLMVSAVSFLGFSGVVSAQNDVLAEREALMKSNGMLLRGAMNATGDAATEAAAAFVDNFTVMPSLFEDPELAGDALPAVWEDNESFLAIIASGLEASETALAAAQAGDQDAYLTAMRQVGGTCQSCHSTYRAD